MNNTLIKIILLILFGFSFNKNLRNLDEPAKLENLLEKIPKFYAQFVGNFYDKSPYRESITLNYFKEAESTGRIKKYLNKKKKELLIVAREAVEAIQVSSGKIGGMDYYSSLFNDLSSQLTSILNSGNEFRWYSLFFFTTEVLQKDKIGFGNLFIIPKGETLDIILISGFGQNISPCKGHGLSYKTYSFDPDKFALSNDSNMMEAFCLIGRINRTGFLFEFLKIVIIKIFANQYNISLDYPKLK